jgi:glycosyltransferase involved in cell wall biosynthesis
VAHQDSARFFVSVPAAVAAAPPHSTAEPLVSIGIPTFDRADSLRRAVASALGQTHRRLEIVISDNGSTDATVGVCRELAASDPRVRVLRQPVNRGPIANFNAVLVELGGEYAMLLADDDWLDADYVERCLAELRARPDHALIGGLPRYYDGDSAVREGRLTNLAQESRGARMRRYLRGVDDNGIFYGLARNADLQRSAPMRDVLGSDWLLVAALAFSGKVMTLPDTHVNRSLGGTSRSIPRILLTVRERSTIGAYVPYLVTVGELFREIAWRSPAYAPAGRARRLALAAWVAPAAMRWRGSLWLLCGPMLLRIARRPWARWLRRPLAWAHERGGDPHLPPRDAR